jgi:hypothetical protein
MREEQGSTESLKGVTDQAIFWPLMRGMARLQPPRRRLWHVETNLRSNLLGKSLKDGRNRTGGVLTLAE